MRRAALLSILSVPAIIVGLGIAPVGATAATTARTAPAVPSIGTSSLGNFSPTFAGPAATGCKSAGCSLLTGPFQAPSTANLQVPSDPTVPDPHHAMPSPVHRSDPPGTPVIPTVSCAPVGPGCDTISGTSGGATGARGLDAVDSGSLSTNPLGDIEPPDQGLCAGNGFVVETNNIGEILVYNMALNRLSAPIPLDTLMGLTGHGYSSGGDPSCLYDQSHGGHWFFTEIVSTNSEASGGAFAGCFAAVASSCLEGIAVTVGSNPFGPYNVYFLNANYNPNEPGFPYLFNDFAKISATRDAFLLFYDEFANRGGGLGGGGFNGSQEFAFDKGAMELGLPASLGKIPNPLFNVALMNLGLVPTPDGTCAGTGDADCWYQTIPAQAPDRSQWDNSHGGSGFMLSSLDFVGNGDNRFAVFDWTGLANLDSFACFTCTFIHFGGQLFSGVEPYYGEGFVGVQKKGNIPLGDECETAGLATAQPCVEGGIATNGDGFTQVSQAQGQIWGAVSTEIDQTYSSEPTQTRQGAAYWVVGTGNFDRSGIFGFGGSGTFSLTSQGYVSVAGEDLEFPTMAAEGLPFQDGGNGGAIMSFTVNGPDYYPSSAFGRVSSTSAGLLDSAANIVDMGADAQDGFSEYQGQPGPTRPRWGDYGWALFVPNSGGRIYFASEYIQNVSCTGSSFALTIPTCGGTRDGFANWGTSVNYVVP
jgi:hypothetical protein